MRRKILISTQVVVEQPQTSPVEVVPVKAPDAMRLPDQPVPKPRGPPSRPPPGSVPAPKPRARPAPSTVPAKRPPPSMAPDGGGREGPSTTAGAPPATALRRTSSSSSTPTARDSVPEPMVFASDLVDSREASPETVPRGLPEAPVAAAPAAEPVYGTRPRRPCATTRRRRRHPRSPSCGNRNRRRRRRSGATEPGPELVAGRSADADGGARPAEPETGGGARPAQPGPEFTEGRRVRARAAARRPGRGPLGAREAGEAGRFGHYGSSADAPVFRNAPKPVEVKSDAAVAAAKAERAAEEKRRKGGQA